MAWAARNYMIYLKITNSVGTILCTMSLTGGLLFLSNKDFSIFSEALGIYGVLVGVGLTFYIKGLNTCAIINIAKTYDIDIGSVSNSSHTSTENWNDPLFNFTISKYYTGIYYIFMNFLTCTLLILINGKLFGIESAIGILIGNCIATLYVML